MLRMLRKYLSQSVMIAIVVGQPKNLDYRIYIFPISEQNISSLFQIDYCFCITTLNCVITSTVSRSVFISSVQVGFPVLCLQIVIQRCLIEQDVILLINIQQWTILMIKFVLILAYMPIGTPSYPSSQIPTQGIIPT